MDIIEVIKGLVFLLGVFISIVLFTLGFRLMRSDKGDYQKNYERSGSFTDVWSGRVKTTHDGDRDYLVKAGLAIDINKNEWIDQGALSEEAIDSVLLK